MNQHLAPFGPCALVACFVCLCLWVYLTYKSVQHDHIGYAGGCGLMSLGFIIEFVQYVLRFYIIGNTTDTIMMFLFLKMLTFALSVIVFVYNYRSRIKDQSV